MKTIIFHEHDLSALCHRNKRQIRVPYLYFQHGTGMAPPQTRPPCPFGEAGDLLAVREQWRPTRVESEEQEYQDIFIPRLSNKATFDYLEDVSPLYRDESGVWNSAETMPMAATRYILQLTDVRLERLQDITVEDAIKEGMPQGLGPDAPHELPVFAYAAHWDDLYGAGCWNCNPIVWVLSFELKP